MTDDSTDIQVGGHCDHVLFLSSLSLSPRKLHPLLEEKDLKNDRPNNYFFWTFATHMAQMPPKKYNFTQFTAFFHFLLIKINYYFV